MNQIHKSARVLHVDHAPIMGGAQLSLIEILQTLGSRFESVVTATGECPDFTKSVSSLGVRIENVSMPRMKGAAGVIGFVRGLAAMHQLIGRVDPDIIHVNTCRGMLASAIPARMRGIPLIWTIRDHFTSGRLCRLLAGFADTIICVSETIHNHYLYPETEDKMVVIPNGILMPEINVPAERARIRAEYRIADDIPLVLCLGNLQPGKGQEHFLEAAAETRKHVPDAVFMVVGNSTDDMYARKLKHMAAQPELAGSVIFTGFRNDPLACISASDLVVQTSVYPEAFGRVVVEAMALGKPVIASPAGGPAEIVEHGKNGLLVSPVPAHPLANAMLDVLTDADLYVRLSRGGLARFQERYSQDKETTEIQKVYDAIMGSDENHGPL